MPLINFKTDLTSLRYGLDRPGGGYSGQPFVQFPIDNENAPTAIREYYQLNRTSLDFPIRGGALQSLVNGSYSALSATIDRERIAEFLKSSPRGTAFVQKQVGLGLTNPRTQVPNVISFADIGLGNAVLPVTQTYNPLNTLAQVQVQGTGAHFNRQGPFPTISENVRQTYQYIAGAPQNNTETTNRLIILKNLKLDLQSGFNPTRNEIVATGADPTLVDRLGISPIDNQLFNYPGGPGSVYGIGNTRIFRVTDTQPTVDPVTQTPYSSIAFTYAQIASQNTHTSTSPTAVTVQNFIGQLTPGTIPFSPYNTFNIQNPYNGVGGLGIGNPGAPIKMEDLLTTKPGANDLLNSTAPFFYNVSETPWEQTNTTKDIIKFAFECIDNDDTSKAMALVFRAFLDGSITDNNTAEYNSFKYLGRGETFRTYQGFNRTISFSFKIFVQTRSEMRPLYTKLNALISQVYPDYSANSNLMRGSVVRMTIGDYIYRMPGFIQNVDVTIDNSNTPWEIQLYGPDAESDVAQLPHLVSVGVTFLPIMDILPRRVTSKNPNVPLIANNNTSFLNSYIDYTTKPKNTEAITISNVTDSDDALTNQFNAENNVIDPNSALSNTSTGKKQGFSNNLRRQILRKIRAVKLEQRALERKFVRETNNFNQNSIPLPPVNPDFRL
jgi:hypothetical protein